MSEEACRICLEQGQYNIFEDELVVTEKTMKIYIVLNNFLFEKLYSPDDYSSLICAKCCDSLFVAYNFLTQVRDSEHKLKFLNEPERKKQKGNYPEFGDSSKTEIQVKSETEASGESYEILEDFIEEVFSEDDENEGVNATNVINNSSESFEIFTETEPKTASRKSNPVISDTFTVTEFSLATKDENGKTVVNIYVNPREIKVNEKGVYDFDTSWLKHSDKNAIYSCNFCVKAFANLDFLVKHISICHVCFFCLHTSENYKKFSEHMLVHGEKLKCPFCMKLFLKQSFRQHIKKQHIFNLPTNVGVLTVETEIA